MSSYFLKVFHSLKKVYEKVHIISIV